jgi:chorismate dehydratase
MRKTKITAVSYLNTKPLLFGLVTSDLANSIDLELDIPSECARKLASGEVDLGLVPVAVIPEIPGARIISDFCIGSDGEVATVCVFADCPIEKLTHLYLDFHSRTSVQLVQILMRDYWKVSPKFVPADEGFLEKIGGTTGALVIGDRTIGLEKIHPYVYDLGQAWKAHTGLPFVFAAWVSNRDLPAGFSEKFNEVIRRGVSAIPQLMYLLQSPHPDFDLRKYFTENISYELDQAKRKGLELFLSLLSEADNRQVVKQREIRAAN